MSSSLVKISFNTLYSYSIEHKTSRPKSQCDSCHSTLITKTLSLKKFFSLFMPFASLLSCCVFLHLLLTTQSVLLIIIFSACSSERMESRHARNCGMTRRHACRSRIHSRTSLWEETLFSVFVLIGGSWKTHTRLIRIQFFSSFRNLLWLEMRVCIVKASSVNSQVRKDGSSMHVTQCQPQHQSVQTTRE